MRQKIVGFAAACGLGLMAAGAQAASIGDFTFGSNILPAAALLDVSVSTGSGGNAIVEGADLSFIDLDAVFASVEVDSDGNFVSDAAPGLDITSFDLTQSIFGVGMDTAVDVAASTFSILYDVTGTNDFSSDDFVLAVLDFGAGSFFDPFDVSLMDLGFAELQVLSASRINPIPLPAGLPLMIVGLGGFAVLSRRRKRKVS
ncbi:MAG: VPLPA-CTERM sorting domain-containing protein [Paracoccaceae bacterium]|nr:VPLPA-CTERM sorting domain-containing protein [Paracoccaceae bacterium]